MREPVVAAALAVAAFIPSAVFAEQAQPWPGVSATYADQQVWAGAPMDPGARIEWLDQRIRTAMADGVLPGKDGRRALRKLSMLRQQERNMSHQDGQLAPRSAAKVQSKLDAVVKDLGWSNPNG